MAPSSPSSPRTLRTVSYCPANEASARSSATLEERTARISAPRARVASSTAWSAGSPTTTNPSGTGKPAWASSPRLAALPPTSSRSELRSSPSRTTALESNRVASVMSAVDPVQDDVHAVGGEILALVSRHVSHHHGVEQQARRCLRVMRAKLACLYARGQVVGEEPLTLGACALDARSHRRVRGSLLEHHMQKIAILLQNGRKAIRHFAQHLGCRAVAVGRGYSSQ